MDKSRQVLTVVLLAVTAAASPAKASASESSAYASSIAQGCSEIAPPPAAWSESEKWAWDQICHGGAADFDARYGTQEECKRQSPDRFAEPRRKLRASFLRTLLMREPYRSAIPPEGVQIIGASFVGDVILRDVVLDSVLGIFDSHFAGKLEMNRLRTPTSVGFSCSTFDGEFSMDSATIGGNLNMEKGKYGEVVLKTVEIVGGITMSGSTITGQLNMNGATVKGALFLRNAKFADVDLTEATVGRQLSTSGSTFAGRLKMGSLTTGGSVLLNEESSFQDVVLRGAQIGGQLSLSEAVVRGQFDGASMSVEQDLIMTGAEFQRPVKLQMIRVGASVDASDAKLSSLNLYGATVVRDLNLGGINGPSVQWLSFIDSKGETREPIIVLWNTSVGALVDSTESWPASLGLLLRDFTYERFLPLDGVWKETRYLRDADWYIDWLSHDRSNSFQPYRQLASVLQAHGEDSKAREVLVAGREQKRLQLPWLSLERWSSFTLQYVIRYGYGAGELWALAWAMPFFLLGGVLARRSGEPERYGKKIGFWYSLDMLLPGIWLSEAHARIVWRGWPKQYFRAHRLIGLILSLFIVAGLTGLTERLNG